MFQRRSLVRCGAALAAAFALATPGLHGQAAEPYPTRAVTLYVAFGPGGAGDITARAITREMTRTMGQAVVVDNRPVPLVAPQLTAKAKPDGYTLMAAGNGTALSVGLFKQLPFDLMKDFTHVSTTAFFSMAFLVKPDSPFHTMADVIKYAKANPGKLNIGTVRIGSTQNLAAEMFKSMAGIDAVLIPYRTTGDLVTAVRTGDAGVAVEILSPVLSQIAAKELKPIATTSAKRFPGLPDVPTVGETLPGFEATSWAGISVPAGTPPAIVSYLNKNIREAVATPIVQKILREQGMIAQSSTPEEMTQRMEADIVKWKAVIEKAGIEKQ